MYKLVIQDDEGKTTVVPLIRDEITIGRKEGNTIRLTERNVSRRHARIVRANGAVQIEDLDSYNGILVNGARIDGRASLNESDRVQIGDYLIELKSEGALKKEGATTLSEQRTQPLERVDPMAATPVPEVPVAAADSGAATQPVASQAASAEMGALGPDATPEPPVQPSAQQAPPLPTDDDAQISPETADTQPGQMPGPCDEARLVVLSSNFAGQEFALDKPASVIGRTEDNDVVINHRSISRHHAKIVREDDRFSIVDLQSSNGVRVNGEEYGKVELRRGDVIDLGHVRLRFVEAGEDFVLGRDAEIVDLTEPMIGGGRGIKFGVIAVVLVGIAVLAILMSQDDEEVDPGLRGPSVGGAESTPPASGQPPATGAQPGDTGDRPLTDEPRTDSVPGGTSGAELPGQGGTDESTVDVVALIARARRAIDEERWTEASEVAQQVLASDPKHADASVLKAQAERELRNQSVFQRLSGAVSSKNHAGAAAAFKEIERESVYRVKARPLHDRARDEYVQKVGREAARFADRGDCRSVATLAKKADALWPEAAEAARSHEVRCRRAARARDRVAARGKNRNRGGQTTKRDSSQTSRDRPDTGSSGGGQSGGGGAAPKKSAEALTAEALQAAMRDNYGRAYKLCEDALEVNPKQKKARNICTISACKLGNGKKAKKHYRRLGAAEKRSLRTLCAREGVNVED